MLAAVPFLAGPAAAGARARPPTLDDPAGRGDGPDRRRLRGRVLARDRSPASRSTTATRSRCCRSSRSSCCTRPGATSPRRAPRRQPRARLGRSRGRAARDPRPRRTPSTRASFDGTRWKVAEMATEQGYDPIQVGGGFEWLGYHREHGPLYGSEFGKVTGDRRAAAFAPPCVVGLITRRQAPEDAEPRVGPSPPRSAAAPSRSRAYRNQAPVRRRATGHWPVALGSGLGAASPGRRAARSRGGGRPT